MGNNRIKETVKRIFDRGSSLRDRIAHSAFWGFNIRFSSQALVLVRTIVLASLLAPRDFGLYGIAMIVMNLVLMSTFPGTEIALIQEGELEEKELNAAWMIKIIRGLLVAGVLFWGAPYAALFFNEPLAGPLIQVLGATIFLSMLRNPAEVYFKKDLRFQTQYVYDLSASVVNFLTAVTLAIYLRNAWALVWGFLAGKAMTVFMSYWLHDYRPNLEFNPSEIVRLLNFGKWLTGNSIVQYMNTKGDDFVVGKFLGSTQLGFYRIAFRASQLIPMGVTTSVTKVFFPVFSKLQDEPDKIEEGFYKTFSVISGLLLPVGVGIFLLIPDFTHLFLGKKWMGIVVPVKIMMASGVVRAISQLWVPLYYTFGEPRFAFYKNVVRLLGIFLPMFPLTLWYGLEGVCVAVLVGMCLSWMFDLVVTSREQLIKLRYSILAGRLVPVFLASGFMGISVHLLLGVLPSGFVSFGGVIALGSLIYFVGLWLYQKVFGYSPYRDLEFFF